MSEGNVKGFEDTENKRCIRLQFDLPIISRLRERKRRKLYYLGLVGPELHDIQDWKQHLAKDVMTAEEDEDYDWKIGRMHSVGSAIGFDVRVLRGEIEHTLANGVDVDGEAPLRSSLDSNGYRFFDYDLINLDFDGGMFHKKVKGIAELLRRQSRTEFLLMITFNVRHKMHKELNTAITDLEARLGGTEAAQRVVRWYQGRPDIYKIKAVVPGIIAAQANHVNLECRAYPPIIYYGKENAKLVHFVFHLKPHDNVLRGLATQSEAQLLGLPSLLVSRAVLELDSEQAPDYNEDAARQSLAFLNERRIDAIVNSAAQSGRAS